MACQGPTGKPRGCRARGVPVLISPSFSLTTLSPSVHPYNLVQCVFPVLLFLLPRICRIAVPLLVKYKGKNSLVQLLPVCPSGWEGVWTFSVLRVQPSANQHHCIVLLDSRNIMPGHLDLIFGHSRLELELCFSPAYIIYSGIQG